MEKTKRTLLTVLILAALIIAAYGAAYIANNIEAAKADKDDTPSADVPADEPDIHTDDDKKSDGDKESGDEAPLPDENKEGMEIAEFAEQYLGYSYAYGGADPSTGFDCSGLVHYVLNHTGHETKARTSAELYHAAEEIEKKDLMPGDLVFFTGTFGDAEVTHVGIYTGEGRMIHAGDEKTNVAYANLWESYWMEHLLGYGRIR